MEEIKVNDYLRTIDGAIYKCTDKIKINSTDYKYVLNNFYEFLIEEDGECLILFSYISDFEVGETTKHSPNIIDLIEVGDYVNGDYVVEVYTYKNGKVQFIDVGELQQELRNKDIKSVVTKEQFNSIKYEVE